MNTALLERALSYAREVLDALLDAARGPGDTDALLARPTPCAGWDLDALLTHMDDALDAFADGAAGTVDVVGSGAAAGPAAPRDLTTRVLVLQLKACALVTAWRAAPAPGSATVGGLPLDLSVIADVAALEITVHGCDVEVALRGDAGPPADLAAAVLAVARRHVPGGLRDHRFADPQPSEPDAEPGRVLLDFLGRSRPVHA